MNLIRRLIINIRVQSNGGINNWLWNTTHDNLHSHDHFYNSLTCCTDEGIVHFIKVQSKDEHSYFQKTAKGYVYPNRLSWCAQSIFYYLTMSEYLMSVFNHKINKI